MKSNLLKQIYSLNMIPKHKLVSCDYILYLSSTKMYLFEYIKKNKQLRYTTLVLDQYKLPGRELRGKSSDPGWYT